MSYIHNFLNFTGKYFLVYSELFVKCTLFHAPANGLAVLLTIKPYRETMKQKLFQIFPKFKRKDNPMQVQPTITENNCFSINAAHKN